jgi:hypothetical protein
LGQADEDPLAPAEEDVDARCELPMSAMSSPGSSFIRATAFGTSSAMIVVFDHFALVSVVEATNYGRAFIAAASGCVEFGQ